MNVLDIYPNFTWWLEGRTGADIEALRAAVKNSEPVSQAALEKLAPARAFHLVGDAATFDLIAGVFDEIVVRYSPTPLKRLILGRRIRAWASPSGEYRFESGILELHSIAGYTAENPSSERYEPLRVPRANLK